MKKIVLIVASSVVLLVLVLSMAGEWWVESILGNIINKNPQRSYDITYKDLDLHTLFQGVTLESAQITPLNVSDTSTVVQGQVDHILLTGIKWGEFLFKKRANIRELTLVQPDFAVYLVEDKHHKRKKESAGGLQGLFGDILTRGVIHNFRLEKAAVVAKSKTDSTLIARVENYHLVANEIQTDSVQVKQVIPFKVGSFHSSLDSGYFHLNEYSELRTGRIAYDGTLSELKLNDVSMSFTKDRMEVSEIVGKQVDLIETSVNHLRISNIDAQSSLYGELDIRAKSILIDGLVLKDFRDKNMQRPPDVEKPMFNGMVESIPIPLKVDSIIIRNSNIYYSELGEGQTEVGTVQFSSINGSIVNVTNIPQYQEQYQSFNASIQAELNQSAEMAVDLEIPYQGESFQLYATFDEFPLDILNPTVAPLAGIEIKSGTVDKIELTMDATRIEASNALRVDYDELGLTLIKDQEHDHHKKGLVSLIANSAIRHHNMPDQGHYQAPEYQSFRDVNRGPFNFMWETVKEGMLYIVPTGASHILLGDPEKKAEKAHQATDEKRKKRHKKKNKT